MKKLRCEKKINNHQSHDLLDRRGYVWVVAVTIILMWCDFLKFFLDLYPDFVTRTEVSRGGDVLITVEAV